MSKQKTTTVTTRRTVKTLFMIFHHKRLHHQLPFDIQVNEILGKPKIKQ